MLDTVSMDEQEITDLAIEAVGGSAAALGRLFDHFKHGLFRFIHQRTQDYALAEDLHSELWVRVANSIRSFCFRGAQSFTSWLFTIARSLIVDHYRLAHTRREQALGDDLVAFDIPAADPSPVEHAEHSALAAAVQEQVDKLAPKQKECIRLRFFTGLSVAETAVAMDTTAGSVKMLQARALDRLGVTMPPSTRDFLALSHVLPKQRPAEVTASTKTSAA